MSLATLIQDHISNPLPTYLTTYTAGVTPLSTAPHVLATLAGYLVTIFSVRYLMTGREPFKLTLLFQAHNVVLTLGSGLLLVLIAEEIGPIYWKHGLFYSICNDDAWTPRLEFYYMINYYIKYLELVDTVFLALKKKQLAFLHVFHHSATALLCYTQLNGRTSVSWVPITLNLTVHVFMYYYYFATAGGAKIWWKKYLTTMQITQFIIDLVAVYFATYQRVAHKYADELPYIGNCAGSEGSAAFGCFLLTSYLGLFIRFYFATYKKAPASVKGGKGKGKKEL